MDTSTLRWILIIIGVIIVASIFLFGNPEKRRSPKASRKAMNRERREPTMDSPPTDAHHGTVDESDAPMPQAQEMVHQEARAARDIRHDAIVRDIDAWCQEYGRTPQFGQCRHFVGHLVPERRHQDQAIQPLLE